MKKTINCQNNVKNGSSLKINYTSKQKKILKFKILQLKDLQIKRRKELIPMIWGIIPKSYFSTSL